MTRQWKPGQLAILHVSRWSGACEWPDDTSQVVMRLDKDGRYWNAVKGDPSRPFTMHVNMTDYYHPLVVIDPEDDGQVRRLWEAIIQAEGRTLDDYSTDEGAARWALGAVQTALRSLVADSKPGEPTRLGAVVEDDDGAIFVRQCGTNGITDMATPWLHISSRRAGMPERRAEKSYADIDAVRVLSEGVTP